MSESKHQFTLLAKENYLKRLINSVQNAKKTINIATLIYSYDNLTKKLCDELEAAAKRGVRVNLLFDTLTYNEHRGRRIGPINPAHKSSAALRKHLERLGSYGANVGEVGKLKVINPYTGRTHTKWSVIDETVYCFGGINLYEKGIISQDYMFLLTDPVLADELRAEHDLLDSHSYRGVSKTLQPHSSWYIDSGKPNDSLIYNEALALSKKATSILLVSQYCPTGPLARVLNQKKSVCFFNTADSTKSQLTKLMIRSDQLRSRIKNSYAGSAYLHAKFMLFTMPDGSRVALTGSHNFNYAGVRFGTKEIALKTTDQSVINDLIKFGQKYIDKSFDA